MKSITIVIYCLLATCLKTNAQTIVLQKLKDNSCIVTPGTIKFTADKITLKNATLKCEKLTLGDKVTTLIVEGMVEITCTDFEMTGNSTDNIAVSGSGTLNIKFSNSYQDSRFLSIKDASKMTITIAKSTPN